jgi:hypothetical protein
MARSTLAALIADGGAVIPPYDEALAAHLESLARGPDPDGADGPAEEAAAAAVVLVLVHTNAEARVLRDTGIPGHYDRQAQYRNAYLDCYAGAENVLKLRPSPTDSPLYAMTYGQGAKIMRRVHASLARRGERNEDALPGAGVHLATHVLYVDPWRPSPDAGAVQLALAALHGYGCATPRSLYLSRGVAMRAPPLYRLPPNGADRMTLHAPSGAGTASPAPGTRGPEFKTVVSHHLYVLRTGGDGGDVQAPVSEVLAVVPDAPTRRALLSALGGLEVEVVEYVRAIAGPLAAPRRVLVYPYSLGGGVLSRPQVSAMVGIMGGLKALCVVAPGSMTTTAASPRPAYVNEAPSPVLGPAEHGGPASMRQVCQLAAAGIQPAGLNAGRTAAAMGAGLLEGIGEDGVPVVSALTRAGALLADLGLERKITDFLLAWARGGWGGFPGVCAAAIWQRVSEGRPPLIDAGAPASLRGAYQGPLVHQLEGIAAYFSRIKAPVIDPREVALTASALGLDAGALAEVLARVLEIRRYGFIQATAYGPFDSTEAARLVVATAEGLPGHPVARAVRSADVGNEGYVGADDKWVTLPVGGYADTPTIRILELGTPAGSVRASRDQYPAHLWF